MLYVDDEKRWRDALELMGRERIEALLRRYPGGPDDPVTDLPVHAPFPSRAFCRQWCLATTSRAARGYAVVGVAMALMATVAVSYAACSLSPFNAQTSHVARAGAGAGAASGPTGGSALTGPAASDRVPTVSTRSSASAAGTASSGLTSMPSNTAPPPVPGTYRVQTVTAVPSQSPAGMPAHGN